MKKIYSLMLAFFLLALTANASVGTNLSLGYNHFKMGNESTNLWGLNLDIGIVDNWSINYSLLLGFNSNHFYVHTTAGMAGGLDLVAHNLYDEEGDEGSAEGSRVLGFLLMILPEGVNYHVPMEGNNIDIIPFFNPLGYDFLGDKYSVSSGIGMKVRYNFPGGFTIAPYAGARYSYKFGKLIYDAGLMFGFTFDTDSVEESLERKMEEEDRTIVPNAIDK